MKDKIAYYLAEGLSAADTAGIVGCSPGYISQLLKDEDFRKGVEEKLANRKSTPDENLLNKYQGLEHKIIKAIGAQLDNAELPHLTKALDSVVKAQEAAMKRVNPALAQQQNNVVQVVQITLPPHAIPSMPVMTLNQQSEVVAIDNKPLSPMSTEGVKNLFSRLKSQKEQQNAAQIPLSGDSSTATATASAGQADF